VRACFGRQSGDHEAVVEFLLGKMRTDSGPMAWPYTGALAV
jgi:hypothetical protein